MLALTKASLKAIFRSPSAVIFSFAFPLIFILVFGFLGGGGKILCGLHLLLALIPHHLFIQSLKCSWHYGY